MFQISDENSYICHAENLSKFAQVAELEDAHASGACGDLPREGSSPFLGTLTPVSYWLAGVLLFMAQG